MKFKKDWSWFWLEVQLWIILICIGVFVLIFGTALAIVFDLWIKFLLKYLL